MRDDFEMRPSNKVGFKTKEKYIITRGNTVFFRIVGERPTYDVMTATAREDGGLFFPCSDKKLVIASAMQLGRELGTKPTICRDSSNREYIYVFSIEINPNENEKEIYETLDRVFSRFFDIYDSDLIFSEKVDEMTAIYKDMAINDSGEEIYLCDGVWLSSDGSLHDRGR